MYLYLGSDDCLDRFPENVSTDFTIELQEPLLLGENAQAGVVEMYVPPLASASTQHISYVFSDLVEGSYLSGRKQPVLCTLDMYASADLIRYSPVTYRAVTQRYVTQIRIYIRDHNGKTPSFSDYFTQCTLEILNN